MSDYRVMTGLGRANGIERDRIVNTFHIRTPGEAGPGSAATAQLFVFRFSAFFQAIQSMMAGQVVSAAVGAHSCKVYGLTKGDPDVVDDSSTLLVDDTFTTPALAGDDLEYHPHPSEVAIAVSLLASPEQAPEFQGLARPRSRRRGRFFLGGLVNAPLLAVAVTGDLRPSTTARNTILDATQELITSLRALNPSAELCVYSRVDGAMRPVTSIIVDNAFDTIRSRGVVPTDRTERAIPGA